MAYLDEDLDYFTWRIEQEFDGLKTQLEEDAWWAEEEAAAEEGEGEAEGEGGAEEVAEEAAEEPAVGKRRKKRSIADFHAIKERSKVSSDETYTYKIVKW